MLGMKWKGRYYRGRCEVAAEKQKRLLTALRGVMDRRRVPPKKLESAVGLLQFVTNVVRPGKAFIARLRDSMKNATSTVATLGPVGRADMKWWLETLPK